MRKIFTWIVGALWQGDGGRKRHNFRYALFRMGSRSNQRHMLSEGRRVARFLIALPVLLLVFQSNSYATTECTAKLNSVWTGDDGLVWMQFENGLAAYVGATDPGTKNILAMATAALLAEKNLTIRFSADSVPCGSSAGIRSDVVGVWLQKY